MRLYLFGMLILLIGTSAAAQDTPGATIFHISSTHTAFPDTGRAKGHTYDGKLYTVDEHYRDSTVLIIAPKNLNAKKSVDLVFWFHGWGNNVDNAATRYELTRQFIASKRNAILVLAETARNAPDSYGGKLEQPGDFKALVNDVLTGLKTQNIIPQNCTNGHILLGGHSGAYRVMARIIKNGALPIDEAMLFDALYAETETFEAWIKAAPSHRFIDLFTDHGGTFDESKRMAKLIDKDGINIFETEEANLVPMMYGAHPVIFIHSLKAHDDIVNPDNFRLMLENTPFLKEL
jgi:hypothetical protein